MSCDDNAEQQTLDDTSTLYQLKNDTYSVQAEEDPVSVHAKNVTLNDARIGENAYNTFCPETEPIDIHDLSEKLNTRNIILSDLLITDQNVNTWTGIPSLAILQELCYSVKQLETVYPNKFSMHCTDRLILTMTKIKQNLSFAALSTLFRIHSATVATYFCHTVHMLGQILATFIYMPEKSEIKNNIPICFRESFQNITIILDCTEVPIATLKYLNCRITTYSPYKSTRTSKFLVGVTPAGLISYTSKAYSGKASDKFIFNHGKLIDDLKPHIDEVMTDKGALDFNDQPIHWIDTIRRRCKPAFTWFNNYSALFYQ
ncbi:uncharacterized protein LOC129766704 [Toxorhynchites rutilus septentrionalis]|uniref:uncharacterized protein LOC129766704 n=1 Tax=Toxorhynchites rutilus septentrionalis TaxID=329112 RepID=UPI0024797A27|nr:uncharacterized protein LOC129766704 [Toxorhynchites rutilus septentrionalis]